ncbi:hypothetical protein AGOR_G00196490 [Albula goreensis]|uniref:Uncharacterized protein n=1 Tax=Albula goreensis TaxID=1534307 RepID=A0A8T3CRT4_9TELE|nr:hypothetical protein AGOR_G00196490 [Albula goreensis]
MTGWGVRQLTTGPQPATRGRHIPVNVQTQVSSSQVEVHSRDNKSKAPSHRWKRKISVRKRMVCAYLLCLRLTCLELT